MVLAIVEEISVGAAAGTCQLYVAPTLSQGGALLARDLACRPSRWCSVRSPNADMPPVAVHVLALADRA